MTSTTLPSPSSLAPALEGRAGGSILHAVFATQADWTTTLLRLVLGAVMLPHGLQKVFGWFGGYGFSGTMNFFTQQSHIPAALAFLAIMAEFAGSLGLITGLFTRIAAFGIAVNMAVAVMLVHRHIGFFMNWFGQYPSGQEGLEYHLLAIGIALYLMVRGGGKASVDGALAAQIPGSSSPSR
jgi:putative oxidoreductase